MERKGEESCRELEGILKEVKNRFDRLDPVQYEARHDMSPREGYARDHWRPLITTMISQYCQDRAALDLGCGGGTYTSIIAKYSSRVLGIDISKIMLDYAKNKHPNLELALADACHIPLRSESIDTVVSVGLFEYIERTLVLKEINRILKSGGICIIQCPNKYGAGRILFNILYRVLGKRYYCEEPSRREMVTLLTQNGFGAICFRMDDGLIWLPGFFDRLFGERLYLLTERFFKIWGRNPFSNEMLFILRKDK